MRTITKEVFTFDELDERAQAFAISQFYGAPYSFDSSDIAVDIEHFERVFNVRVKNWEVGTTSYPNFELEMDNDIGALKGKRLMAWLYNNCDEQLKSTKDVRCYFSTAELYDRCRQLLNGDSGNYDSQYAEDFYSILVCSVYDYLETIQYEMFEESSDEYIADMIVANEYEFDIDGIRI